jgi:ABC-type branched-subunit amino acid transport system substrate-binding protein
MKINRPILPALLLALMLTPVSNVAGQTIPTGGQAEAYDQALALFREGRAARAAELLQQALAAGTLGAHRASGWLLLAASRLALDAPEEALGALDGLDREFPQGPYTTERLWLRARAHARAGRELEAARVYAQAWEADRGGRIGTAARDALAELVAFSLEDAERARLGTELAGGDLKAQLVLQAARSLSDRGDLDRARRLLTSIEAEAPAGGYGAETDAQLRDLAERLRSAGPSGFVLGVLLPLTGPDEAVSRSIADAVRLAVAQSGADVRLAFRDTGGSLPGTQEGTLALIRDEGAHLLLAPYLEELAQVTAGLAEASGVPVILPYTHGSSAVRLGENVFQLQATPRLQAMQLAEMAVDSLDLHTFAVLNPLTPEGSEFADTFIARVEEKGASVVAHQYYFPGASDFSVPLEAIRRQGLALSLADTSAVSVTDDAAIAAANRDTLENLVPVGSIDALVVPAVGVDDAVAIAIQADFFWLVTTILGGPSWDSYAVLQNGQQYVDGVVFTDTWSMNRTALPWIEFANIYFETYGRQPDRSATFAWDATRLALSAWQLAGRGENRRAALRRWLAGVEAFEGASGPVNLARNPRLNDNVFLLQISGNVIIPRTER